MESEWKGMRDETLSINRIMTITGTQNVTMYSYGSMSFTLISMLICYYCT